MRLVSKIDYASIAALLAVLYIAKKKALRFNGNMPINLNIRSFLANSGFLYTLFSKNRDAGHQYNISADNQLFTLNKRCLKVVGQIRKKQFQYVYQIHQENYPAYIQH